MLPAGQLGGFALLVTDETHQLQIFPNLVGNFALPAMPDLQTKRDVLFNRQMWKQGVVLEDNAYIAVLWRHC